MRGSMRSLSKPAFVTYLVCFVAGGATVALAAYAFRASPAGRAVRGQAANLSRSHADHSVDQAAPVLVAVPQIEAPVAPIVIARAGVKVPIPDAADDKPVDGGDIDADASHETWTPARSDTYRTVCVRLCDGSYYPISFATTRDRFKADAAKCQAGCGTPARLYYGKAGPGEIDDMIDVHGAAYSDLTNAFKFRTSYDAACTCHGQPDDEASIARHRLLAKEAQVARANPTEPPLLKEKPAVMTEAGRVLPETSATDAAGASALVTGSIRRRQWSSVAASGDIPVLPAQGALGTARRSIVEAPPAKSSAKTAIKAANGATKPAEIVGKKVAASLPGKPKAAKVQAAAVTRRTVVASGPVGPSRGVLYGVRGASQTQRAFRSQDFWRLSYWEPRS